MASLPHMTAEFDLSPARPATAPKGCRLSSLLRRVGEIIEQHAGLPVWVRAELSAVSERNGHLYLDLVEHDERGTAIAKVRANAWRNVANAIQRTFAEATGSRLQAGIKVLLQVQVTFHVQHGLALQVLDIDPAYTVGEMAAKVQRIRQTLIAEGVFERNRHMPRPVDFFRVAVVAPAGAAGLGDFQANAKLLADNGVCSFAYYTATFQGPAAADSVTCAITEALGEHLFHPFDALVLIRGGGAAADLAWLNELVIARAICEASLPVLVGIGHERDRTILDEVACWVFDTPSKVIAGIENVIRLRAQSAVDAFAVIMERAHARLTGAEAAVVRYQTAVRTAATDQLHTAQVGAERNYAMVRSQATAVTTQAGERIEGLYRRIRDDAVAQIERAQFETARQLSSVTERALARVDLAEQAITRTHGETLDTAQERVARAEREAQSLFSTIFSLGPAPTLARGFIIARHEGRPISTVAAAQAAGDFDLQFKDGTVHVHIES